MGKIALMAANASIVRNWQRESGVSADDAVWVTTLEGVRGQDFTSLYLLEGWDRGFYTQDVRDELLRLIEQNRARARASDRETLATERAEQAIPSQRVETSAARTLLDFGVHPTLVSVLDHDYASQIAEWVVTDPARARMPIETLASRRGIPAWTVPETVPRHAQTRAEMILRINRWVDVPQCDLMTMQPNRLAVCYAVARRAHDALRFAAHDGDPEIHSSILYEARGVISREIREAQEEHAAGFEDAPSVLDAATEPVVPRPHPVQRPVAADPLRDSLSSYMREARRSDADARADREMRRRARDETTERLIYDALRNQQVRNARDQVNRIPPDAEE